MTILSDAFEGEQPSFEDITLYQLCYWKVTCIYGLTQEEIETLITNPDPQTPSHHQVDPRIIKAYLTGESVPTYLPGHLLSCHFGILPMYLPRDQFLPSELVVPLVDAQYCRDYQIWKRRLDANTRATDFLVDHLRDPLLTISQVIEAPVHTSLSLLSELQNTGGGMDISTHITASTTDRNYTAMRTHVRRSVHLSALLIT
jgi:hypothetical protein